MTRLSEIQSHIASMGELLDIVGAMRSLAGMRVQESQHVLPGIRSYADSMAAAIGSALLLMPQPVTEERQEPGRRALILCMAEHGFVGGFNERVLEAAEATLEPSDLMFVLGSRGAALAFERGRKAAWTRPTATRPAGAPDAVDRLTNELYARVARGEVARIEVMFCRYRQGAASTIERRLLLPLDMATLSSKQARQVPLHNLPPRPLLEKLMAEYIFALLMRAAVEFDRERERRPLCRDGVCARQCQEEARGIAGECATGAPDRDHIRATGPDHRRRSHAGWFEARHLRDEIGLAVAVGPPSTIRRSAIWLVSANIGIDRPRYDRDDTWNDGDEAKLAHRPLDPFLGHCGTPRGKPRTGDA